MGSFVGLQPLGMWLPSSLILTSSSNGEQEDEYGKLTYPVIDSDGVAMLAIGLYPVLSLRTVSGSPGSQAEAGLS